MSAPLIVDSQGRQTAEHARPERSVRQKWLFDYIPLPMMVASCVLWGVTQQRIDNIEKTQEIARLAQIQVTEERVKQAALMATFSGQIDRLTDRIEMLVSETHALGGKKP